MPHPKSMTKFMVYHLFQKNNVRLIFWLSALRNAVSVPSLDNLLEGCDTGSIFDGAQPENPFVLKLFNRIVSIINQQICNDVNRITVFGEFLCKEKVHFSSIVIFLVILRYHRIKLL